MSVNQTKSGNYCFKKCFSLVHLFFHKIAAILALSSEHLNVKPLGFIKQTI